MLLCIRCIDHIIIAKVRRINPHQGKHRILLGIRQIRSQRKIWLIIRLDCHVITVCSRGSVLRCRSL